MVEDLRFPVQITAGEIVRAEDGLALSSRNSFLDEDERPRASQLYKSLRWVEAQILEGRRDYMTLADEAAEQLEAASSEEHTSELQSRGHLVCRLLLEKKKVNT